MEDDFNDTEMFAPRALKTARPGPKSNPLTRFYRTPGLHVKLPSGGRFLPPGSIETTLTGEVEVYAMRAADEMLLKSPDALMSGYALEKLLESCVPAIKTPRLISTSDLDVLLVAIRAASFGEMMEIEAKCPNPECGETSNFEISLPGLISTVKPLPDDTSLRLAEDLVLVLRPYNFENATRAALTAFDVARRVQNMDEETDTVRLRAMSEGYKTIADLNEELAAECVMEVSTPDGVVTDRSFIRDFMHNIDRVWTGKIQERIKELNGMGMDKSVEVTCPICETSWKTEVEIDPSRFFGQGF